jgi:hypothetical protein
MSDIGCWMVGAKYEKRPPIGSLIEILCSSEMQKATGINQWPFVSDASFRHHRALSSLTPEHT